MGQMVSRNSLTQSSNTSVNIEQGIIDRVAISLLEWGERNQFFYPWRSSTDPYRIFIAEVLLKRTTVKAAERVYNEFINKYPDFESIYRATDLETTLAPIGLSIQRAKLLHLASAYIIEKYGGRLPDNRRSLLEIPGIGEYIADAILCFAYGKPLVPVDSNVTRVISRVFGFKTPKYSIHYYTAKLLSAIDINKCRTLSWALIDLGRVICRPVIPLCSNCPLRDYCLFVKNKQ
jgi:A/G-specific adenine glycosylase